MERKFLNADQLETIYTTCSEERETTINVLGNECIMEVYTADNVMLTKLKKILEANPNTVKCWEAGRTEENKVTGYFFEMPKKHLSLRMVAGKEMTEEQKAAFGKRVKQMYAEGKLGKK